MNKIVFAGLVIFICVFSGGCQGSQAKSADLSKNGTHAAQSPTANPSLQQTPDAPSGTKRITESQAIEKVAQIVGTLPKGFYLEIDHVGTVDNKEYYIVHFYETVVDDEKTKTGHSVTYGWYYVDSSSGNVYEMDMVTGKLSKLSAKPTGTLKPSETAYKLYKNGRYQFSIEYPENFTVKMLPENYDGIILASPDGSAELTVSGINNVLGDTAASAYNKTVKEYNPSYKKQQDSYYVVSWTEGDRIVYEKCVVGSGSENTFVIKYPSSQKEIYSPLVDHLYSTFKTPSVSESH